MQTISVHWPHAMKYDTSQSLHVAKILYLCIILCTYIDGAIKYLAIGAKIMLELTTHLVNIS